VIGGLYNVSEAKATVPADNFIGFASDYGKQIEHWNGVDVAAVARLPFGLRLQGGTSTGKTLTDNCEIRAALPEIAPTNPWCRVDTGWLTHVSGFATYTFPKVDILTSITFQNRPSRVDPIQANYTVTSAEAQKTLGRPLSGGSANVTVPLINPYTVQGDRFTQIDLRFGNFDIYNATNSHAILSQNSSFDVWQQPGEILLARFLKVGMQFDF